MYASQRSPARPEGVREQVEHLPVEVALNADEGRDRLGRFTHEQALAHFGIPEALAVGLDVAEGQERREQRVGTQGVEAEPLGQLVCGRR